MVALARTRCAAFDASGIKLYRQVFHPKCEKGVVVNFEDGGQQSWG
ncbi:hypothetical protein ACK3YM_17245 [Aeromonas caviae]